MNNFTMNSHLPSYIPTHIHTGINMEKLYKKYSAFKNGDNWKDCSLDHINSHQSYLEDYQNQQQHGNIDAAKSVTINKNTGPQINESSIGSSSSSSLTSPPPLCPTRIESKKLDSLTICFRCHGYGFIKEEYNHQVKEVNCDVCDCEGLLSSNKK